MGKFFQGLFEELKLYVRQSAWLSAALERPPNERVQRERVTRISQMRKTLRDEEYVPEMPPLGADYLLAYLFEIGPTLYSSAGEAPLNHLELAAWQQNTGIELSAWESRCLLQLSREYMLQTGLSEKANCKPPWMPDGLEFRRTIALGMREGIREMMKS